MTLTVRGTAMALVAIVAAGIGVPARGMSYRHLERLVGLSMSCSSSVAPRVVAAVMDHESGGDPFAIGDNDAHRGYHLGSAAEAAALAHTLSDIEGHSIDVGVMQLNSANVRSFGLSWTQAFDTCTNVAYCSRILSNAYHAAPGDGDERLLAALSAYNTGHYFSSRGRDYAGLVRDVALSMPREAFGFYRTERVVVRAAYHGVAAPRPFVSYRVYREPSRVTKPKRVAHAAPAPLVVEVTR